MSTFSQFAGGGGGGINSIQRGTITLTSAATATATITSVDTSKSELRYLGESINGAVSVAALAGNMARVVLTNSTTITATRASGGTDTTIVSWELTEWN